jgi:fused signal recognition particle receptor
MSFFRKLKDRMFKSSSRLDEGLDAIIEEGAEESGEEALSEHREDRVIDTAPDPAPPIDNDIPPQFLDAEPEAEPEPEPMAAPVPEPEPVPEPAPPPPAPDLTPEDLKPQVEAPPPPEAGGTRPGLLGRLMGRGGSAAPRRALDDDMLEQLEELLITADMGVETAMRVTANMAEGRYGKMMSAADIKELLAAEVARVMEPVARPLPLYPKKPQVVLVVGVNGSGKTTTIGKLASQFKAAGKSVVIAAGDTFRAAAVEQLQVWGERAGVPVLTAPEGSDPAASPSTPWARPRPRAQTS